MAKVKLGARPKSFPVRVTFPLLEGEFGEITWVFKYRTRTEFGAFIDALLVPNGIKREGDDDAAGVQRLMQMTRESNADYLLQIAEGWDVDADFNRENVQQFCDELPGAVDATMTAYRAAIHEGRRGN